MQAGVLVSGAQLGKIEEPGTLGGVADAAGKVDAAVVQALGQFVEADLDPFVFPARIAGDGREQGHGVAGKLLALALEDAVLVEIADTDDLRRPVIGGDVFRREKVEGRPVQGQVFFRHGGSLPGRDGESGLRAEQEQAEQGEQQSSEHGTFSQHAAAPGMAFEGRQPGWVPPEQAMYNVSRIKRKTAGGPHETGQTAPAAGRGSRGHRRRRT